MLNVYCIFDSKVSAYMNPFYAHSKGNALGSFSEGVNDTSIPLGKRPADFVLFELGAFDDDTGRFSLYDAPVSLGVGVEYVRS